MSQNSLDGLTTWLTGKLSPPAGVWFTEMLARITSAAAPEHAFAMAWSTCGRKLGREELTLDRAAAESLTANRAPFLPERFAADELGRALLLLGHAGIIAAAELPGRVEGLFRTGEMREQQALLKVLPHLPGPERFLPVAVDAVRTNVLSVIEAVACENPYPARHFPELAFNQMIMKALFNGLPLARVYGLRERINPELQRMVEAWVSERRAAGRPVPADVELVLGGTTNAPV